MFITKMFDFVKYIFGLNKKRAVGYQEHPVLGLNKASGPGDRLVPGLKKVPGPRNRRALGLNKFPGCRDPPAPQLHKAAGPQNRPVPGLIKVPGPGDRPVPGLHEAAGPRDRPVPELNEVPGRQVCPVPGLNEVPGLRDRPAPGLNKAPGPQNHPVLGLIEVPGPRDRPVAGLHEASDPQNHQVPGLNEATGPQNRPVPGLNEAPGPRYCPVPGLHETSIPQDRPIPGLHEAPGPQNRPLPELNEVPGLRDLPVAGLNEVAGPRDHPEPKPGVRRKRQSGEEEEEEEEIRPFKRQRTLRFLPWPRLDFVDEPLTATDRICDLRNEKTSLLAKLFQAKKQLLSVRARHDGRVKALKTYDSQDVDQRLLAENLFLKQQVLELSQSREALVGANEALTSRIKGMEDNATKFFEVIQAGFESRTMELRQENLKLLKTQKAMVAKIKAMEDEYFEGRPELRQNATATHTAMQREPYFIQPPLSPSWTPLPLDYDSDDSLYGNYQAQGEKRKREELAHSRSANPPVPSELNDFFRRNRSGTQTASTIFPFDETVVVPPPSLLQPSHDSTAASQPTEVVYDFRNRARKRQKLYGTEKYKDSPFFSQTESASGLSNPPVFGNHAAVFGNRWKTEKAPGGTLFLNPPSEPQP